MTMIMNKKNNQIGVDCKNVASLLTSGKEESARIRTESVIYSKQMVQALETLQLMCELLAARIGLITATKYVYRKRIQYDSTD